MLNGREMELSKGVVERGHGVWSCPCKSVSKRCLSLPHSPSPHSASPAALLRRARARLPTREGIDRAESPTDEEHVSAPHPPSTLPAPRHFC